MREPRNPFRHRYSEQIESEATFIRLFGPGVLDLLPKDHLWDRVQIIRSAAGGGKTSLMRLFTPNSLLTLHAYRAQEECKELYGRMRELDALTEEGPHLLGVLLSCARSYDVLADMEFDAGRTERLFLCLLNARIVLATLRGSCALKRLNYPQDLDRITVGVPPGAEIPVGLELPTSGRALYDWAQGLEKAVCEAMDSFGPSPPETLPGHSTLVSLTFLHPKYLTVDNTVVADRIVVMLDDVHRLAASQRERLIRLAVGIRPSIGLWIAERFEAMGVDEMLSAGATEGRDYDSVIELENYWRKGKRIKNLLLNIADRRAQSAASVQIESFGSCLQSSLDGTEWQQKYEQAHRTAEQRLHALTDSNVLFSEWVAARQRVSGTARERALAWRTLEILIERERRKSQQTLNFALAAEDLESKDDSDVRAAGDLFLARELGLPYYFGSDRLAELASSNIAQFLWLAGDAFEEIVSGALIRKTRELTPLRQDTIIRNAVQTRWSELPRQVQHGREVRQFLEAVGRFASYVTYLPNAPYSPGVTGIAISMADRERLQQAANDGAHNPYSRLGTILALTLAHNLLEPILDYKCKGERWMVLYLNRFLCVQFNLPLQYGGWREKTLGDLLGWIDQGFRPPAEGNLL